MSSRWWTIGVGVLLFGICLSAYCATLAPTITWRHAGTDSGDLVTAAYTLGIAHPTGYPLFALLGKAFTLLPVGDVAYRVNLMSAVFAAAAVGIVYATALTEYSEDSRLLSAVIIGAASALVFGFSHTLWSQAVIAEVYSLHAFLVALVVCLVTLFALKGTTRLLWILCFVLGLSLGNHLSVILFLPGLLFLVLRKRRPTPTTGLAMAGCFLLGLSIYLYLPLRAAQNPPINWGAPDTWPGFWWVVSGSIYTRYAFALPLAQLPGRISSWMSMLVQQFTWVGVTLGLIGIWDLWEEERDYFVFSMISYGAVVVYSVMYYTTDSYVYLIPSYLLFALWIARGAWYCLHEMLYPWIEERWDAARSRSHLLSLVSLSLLLLPAFLLYSNRPSLDLSDDWTAFHYAEQIFSETPSEALIIADTDAHIFSLWYWRYVIAPESQNAIIAKGLFHYRWYKETLNQHHPRIVVPAGDGDPYAQLLALIDANLPHRSIYLTDSDDAILTRYAHIQVGSLYKLGVKG
jgi:hypothetical protein